MPTCYGRIKVRCFMLKITTWNVNGVRARKEQVLAWLEREQPDVLCLQEVKAANDKVPPELSSLPGYHAYFHGHGGYSGVAILFRKSTFPRVPRYAHPEFDHETRIVVAQAAGLTFASIYVPNGGKSFEAKVRFLDAMAEFAARAHAAGEQLILCGDLNVTLEPRDVHPSQQKEDQIGQTPQERAQLRRILAQQLVDLARKFHAEDDRLFTWWAPWRNSRERNIGWRLDYVLCSRALSANAVDCTSYREFGTSDHGPVQAVFDLEVPRETESEPALAQEESRPGQLNLF